ncbi:MAG: putative bifunctional diguanylate cyclase/phosphodiesterase [Geminicoccaceae bacterium]
MVVINQRPVRGTRLFAKLVLVIVPCFLAASSIGLFSLAEIDLQQGRDALATRIGNATARVASALERFETSHVGDTVWLEALPQELLSTLLADQAIRCVELRRDDTGEPRLSAPFGLGCTGQVFEESLDLPVIVDGDHTLVVHFSTEELEADKRSRREFSILTLSAGLMITVLSSWLGFALIVGRPLSQLLSAIRRSQETGEPARIGTDRRDELGVVFDAFDSMQAHLSQETAAVRRAFEQLERIYNTTPVMLCSCDADGILIGVSDHWTATIDAKRDAVLGQSIERFMDIASVPLFRERVLSVVLAGHNAHDVPVKLHSRDCRPIDVLLSAVPDIGVDGKMTILCVMSDVSLLKAAERRLHQLALTDSLTGLPNRRGLIEQLGRVTNSEVDPIGNTVTAVLFIDLDNFKWINDTYGHEAGDSLLVEVGERLRLCVRVNDFIARLGGDEFAVICYRLESRSEADDVAQRIIETLEKPFQLGSVQGFVSASVGIAYAEPGMEGPDCILQLADLAMYDAKQSGKGCHRSYSRELSSKATAKAVLREQIHKGLDTNGFSLAFQPIINLESGIPIGAEALVRLNCPNTGLITPDAFIPVAEETGQIHELGNWIIEKGVADLRRLEIDAGNTAFYIALNVSTRQLDERLIGRIEGLFVRHPSARGRVVLEITETALLQRGDHVADLLQALRKVGVRIALDDFGTGYSSLSHVHEFPVDMLKIDKSFVIGLGTHGPDATRRQMAMIRATSSLAQELGIAVIAEGIEAPTTSQILLDCSVQFGQGYHFASPMRAAKFRDWYLEAIRLPAPTTVGS